MIFNIQIILDQKDYFWKFLFEFSVIVENLIVTFTFDRNNLVF